MKKKLVALLLALSLIVGGVAACGADSDMAEDHEANALDSNLDSANALEIVDDYALDVAVEADIASFNTEEERAFSAWNHYLELTGAFQAYVAGAWAADFIMNIEMDLSFMSFSMVSTGHMAHIQTDEENARVLTEMNMVMTTDMDIMDITDTMNSETVLVSYVNMVDGDMNMRLIVDGYEMPEEFISAGMIDEMTGGMVSVPEFNLEDIDVVKIVEDGNYTTFSLLLDATALNEFMQEAVASQVYELSEILGDYEGFNVELAEEMVLILVMYGNDENPVSLAMEMDIRFVFDGEMFEELGGEAMSMRMRIEYIYTAFGEDVVIVAPAQGLAMPGLPGFPEAVGELPEAIDDNERDLAEELVGYWDWDIDERYTYIFNSDGTGTRGFPGQVESFEWTTDGDYLFIGWEHWVFSIVDGVLTIESRQVPDLTFSYIAR